MSKSLHHILNAVLLFIAQGWNLNQRIFRPSVFSVVTAVLVSGNLPGSSAFAQAAADKSSPPATAADAPVDQLIPWLLDEDRQLRGIPFAEVIFDATGKRVLPVNAKDEIDQRVIKQISAACDETIKQFNAPDRHRPHQRGEQSL